MLDKDTDMTAPGGEGGFKSLRERTIEKLLKFIKGNLKNRNTKSNQLANLVISINLQELKTLILLKKRKLKSCHVKVFTFKENSANKGA